MLQLERNESLSVLVIAGTANLLEIWSGYGGLHYRRFMREEKTDGRGKELALALA